MTSSGPPRSLRLSVGVASAAALAYEILLLRLFSITQFHHTAYMVISLALLGYGASGTVLTAVGPRWKERFSVVFGALLVAAGLAMPLCFAVAQRAMVHPEEMLWSPRQAIALSGVYLLLAVPFLLVALALGLALMRHRPRSVYAWDLAGAGAGSLLVLALLWTLDLPVILRLLGALAILAGALEGLRPPRRRTLRGAAVAAAALALWTLPASWLEPRLSPYKGLTQALRIEGATLVEQLSSPLALISVIENRRVPLRHAPGLSLAAPREPPEQIGLFIDGEALTPITRGDDRDALSYLDYSTAALPYHVRPPSSVLVLGAGGGEGVLRALELRPVAGRRIVGVEIDSRIVRLVKDHYGGFAGGIYEAPGVEIVRADIRGFVSRRGERFDLVEHVALGGFGGGGPALAALAESYLYTRQALSLYLDRLRPKGILALTTWAKNPPRDTVKLAATAIEALEHRGVGAPAEHLAVIRGWQTSTLMISAVAFSAAEVERLRRFCRERFFDVVFYAGMEESEANRYNRLDEPAMHRAVRALAGRERDELLARYEFAVAPATDDRPFFHQFFRWRTLPRILEARGRGGLSLLEAGYLVLVVTLVQGLVAGAVLVLVPWLALRRVAGASVRGFSRARLVALFGALGLGFLFLEVAFLQKLILLLHYPVYSAAVVLASFLVFAGLGSAASDLATRRWGARDIAAAAGAVVVIGLVDVLALGLVTPWLTGSPLAVRVVAAVSLIAPLAFFMGMPFPLALARLEGARLDGARLDGARLEGGSPRLVPWAWGINGCASVVSPILATLAAVHVGFTAVILAGLAAYAAAAWASGLEAAEAS